MVGMGTRGAGIMAGLGLGGILSLVVSGITHDRVREKMRAELLIARDIPTLVADPKSAQAAAAEQHRRDELARELAELCRAAGAINRREPLLANVFPTGGPPHLRVRFMERYRDAIADLLTQLRAGGLPTEAERAAAREDLAERDALEREKVDEVSAAWTGQRGVGETNRVLQYAQAAQARRLWCYATAEAFARSPSGPGTGAPRVEELWFAQVELWIQQDVVAAIEEMNEEAAAAYGKGACVEQMPVKRIWSVFVLGYQLQDGLLPFQVPSASRPALRVAVPVSFTGRMCDGEFDVVVFQMAVVLDQRDVLQLIDRIAKRNFYQCTAVKCAAVPPADAAEGYLYGTEPAMYVGLEFELYMWREIYGPLMPAGVRGMLEGE
jgi:hypothetical protein